MKLKVNNTIIDTENAHFTFSDYDLEHRGRELAEDAPKTIRQAEVYGGGEYNGFSFTFYGEDAEKLEALMSKEVTHELGKGVNLEDFYKPYEGRRAMQAMATPTPATKSGLHQEREDYLTGLLEKQPITEKFDETLLRSLQLEEVKYLMVIQTQRIWNAIQEAYNKFQNLRYNSKLETMFHIDNYGGRRLSVVYTEPNPDHAKNSMNAPTQQRQVTVYHEAQYSVPGEWINDFIAVVGTLEKAAEDKKRLDDANTRDKIIGQMLGRVNEIGETFDDGEDIPF